MRAWIVIVAGGLLVAGCSSRPVQIGPPEGPAVAAASVSATTLPFVGTWVAEDGDLLEMTPTTYHLNFGFENGRRDNYGEVLSADVRAGEVLLRYTRVVQDGKDVEVPSTPRYMTYRVEGDTIRKWVDTEKFKPEEVDGKPPFRRRALR